jgi:hypothetical protein
MNAATRAPSPTRRRIVRLVLAVAGVAIGGALVALVAARASILDAVLKDRLAAFGLREVALRVVHVGLGETRIEGVRLGWALKAGRIAVGYRLGDLARGRVERIDVEDLAFDASGIDEWLDHVRKAVSGPAAATPARRDWPTVRLRDGRIVGSFPWGSVEVAIAGALAPTGAATAEFRDGSGRVRVAGQPIEFAELAGTVAVEEGAGAARVILTQGRLGDGRAPALFPPLRLTGEAARKGDALDARVVAEGQGFGRIQFEGAMDLARSDVQAAALLDDVSVAFADGAVRGATGVVRLERLGPPAALAIRLDRARVEVAGRAIGVADLAARATVAPDAQAGTPAVVADIENVVVSADPPMFPPLRLDGRVEWRQGAATFRAGARPGAITSAGASVTVEGVHDLARGRGRARIAAPLLALGPDGFRLTSVAPGLEWIQAFNGSVAGEADLTWDEHGIDGSGRVEVNDVTFAAPKAWIEAVSGAVRFDRLRPPALVTLPELHARLIAWDAPLEEPRVRFRLEPAGEGLRLRVERAEARLAGARFVLKDAVFDPSAETQRLAVELHKADLAMLLRLLEIDGVRGRGTISGGAAVAFGNDTVAIEDGRLDAEGGGILEFRSEAARRALAGGGEATELLLRALERFHYKRLSVTIQGVNDDAIVRLSMEGANPDVLDGQPFVVNVNLSGNLGRVLRAILEGYRLSNRALRATVGGRR